MEFSVNHPILYLMVGFLVAVVLGQSVYFLVKALRRSKQIGMDQSKIRKTIKTAAVFTIAPAVSIVISVITLSKSLGLPLPWLRLSVVGALHYETSVADVAARGIGLSGLNADEMTATAYTTIALLLAVGIMWGIVCMILFGKKYSSKLSGGNKKSGGPNFGDDAMTAMFIGLITAYIGSYIGTLIQVKDGALVCTGEYLPLVTLVFSAATMGVFVYLAEKKKQEWVDNFSIAGSMLVGMAAAVVCGMIF